jgi:general secretion pathway protein F/type IV pilus assembly protein PilC
MALIITPGQLNQRAELYHTLGSMLAAGMTAPKALDHLQRNPPARSLRAPIARLQEYLNQGHSVGSAAGQMGGWMPAFDAALIEAGDRSGRLDQCFKLLGGYYKERAQMARQLISDLLYPAGLLHFAVFIFAFLDFLKPGHGPLRFAALALGPLLAVYGFVACLLLAGQGRRGVQWRSMIESVTRRIPVLGVARRSLALARLAAALEALLNAGVVVTSAWDMAVAASGSPALGRAVSAWKEPLAAGSTPADLISQSREFPEMFASLYHSGEISGQLEETLGRLHTHYQEEGTRKMRAISLWLPRLVYYAVMLMVGWHIISFYQGMYGKGSDLDKILNDK